MIRDYVMIRKGTSAKAAFSKIMTVLWKYILHNSRNFETEDTITIRFERRRR